MSKPLCIDLYAGLGGWTEGFLAEGWDVIGFDIEQHVYGEHRYPAQLVLQDVRTIDGARFKDAAMIVASSPCQEFSYRAMPWKRAKALPPPHFGMELFAQAARIQKEASAAAGHHIPMIQENVRGAQKWVGRATWHYGSYYLWGDVPALMPFTHKGTQKLAPEVSIANRNGHSPTRWTNPAEWDGVKNPGFRFDGSGRSMQSESVERHTKNTGGSWFNIGSPGQKVVNRNPVHDAAKGADGGWFNDNKRSGRDSQTGYLSRSGSKSKARKAASAAIAKIPFPLASHIARVYHP